MWERLPLAPAGRQVIRKTGSGIRRGWVSQPIGRGNPAPTIADTSVTGDSILPLAPERLPLAPAGRTEGGIRSGWILWAGEPRRRGDMFGWGNPAPTIADTSVTGDSILPLAPEGRHVYSTQDKQISLSPRGRKTGKTGKRGRERYLAPEGRHVYRRAG